MRLTSLLGCLYVLLLTVRPCCADEVCTSSFRTNTEQAGSANPSKECAGCSPFFACGTCIGFVMAKPVIHCLSTTHSVIKLPPFPVYLQPFAQEASLSIWQPPQWS